MMRISQTMNQSNEQNFKQTYELTVKQFNNLTLEQAEQILFQVAVHQHSEYEIDIYLDRDTVLKNFRVYSNVMRPELMTSLILAKELYKNKQKFSDKVCLDMGCGCGLLGIVLAKYGARFVIFSDIYEDAVKNTVYNIELFDLSSKTKTSSGDLFDTIKTDIKQIEFIVFNHPFFPDKPIKEVPITISMLDDGKLIKRFLEYCSVYIPSATIIMPFYEFAESNFSVTSTTNNPETIALGLGYKVDKIYSEEITDLGVQDGKIKIFEIKKP